MNKFLILLLIMLDGFMLSSNDMLTGQSFNIEAPVIECFELDATGQNMVDSVKTYEKSGAIIQEWIYYSDGSQAIFTSDFQIKDLKLRQAYIHYKNSQAPELITYYKDLAAKMVDNNTKSIADYLYFNAYLNSQGIATIESYQLFKEIIKVDIKEENNTRPSLLLLYGLLFCLSLLTFTLGFTHNLRSRLVRTMISENTS
jgi:hypothetical protein